jgi:HSP20 family protein
MKCNEDLVPMKPDAVVRPELEHRASRPSRRCQGESTWWPELEIAERDRCLVARLALGGIAKNELSVFIDSGGLVVEGAPERGIEARTDDHCATGPTYAKFRRPIPMTDGLRPEDVTVTFTPGVLELRAPLRSTVPARQPRKGSITIRSDESVETFG